MTKKKITMRPAAAAFFILMTASLLLQGCSTVRKSGNFTRRAAEVQKVAVVDPEVMITRLVFKGDNEILFDESAKASTVLREKMENDLASRGYDVVPFEITPAMLKKNPDLKLVINRLKDTYEAKLGDVSDHWVRKLKWKDFDLTLGSDINIVADALNVDVLIFSSSAGFVKSGGEIAKSVAKSVFIAAGTLGTVVYVENQSAGQVHITMVDGDNGEFLWHNFSNPAMAYNLTKEGDIEAMSSFAFNPFPKRKAYDKAEEPLEVMDNTDIEGGSRRKVNLPYETGKAAVEITKEAGSATYDLTAEALRASAQVTSSVPKAAFNLLTLGVYRSKKGEADSAIKAYEDAVKADHQNPWPHILLADNYQSKGEHGKAIKHLKQAISLNSKIPVAHKMLADIYDQKGDTQKAQAERTLYENLQSETGKYEVTTRTEKLAKGADKEYVGYVVGSGAESEEESIVEIGLARDLKNIMFGGKVIDKTEIFYDSDEKIVWYAKFSDWGKMKNSFGGKFHIKWYYPDGSLQSEEKFKAHSSNQGIAKSDLNLDSSLKDRLYGRWHVMVWRKDTLIDDRYFSINKAK